MADINYEFIDSLSTYDISVLSFTSPSTISDISTADLNLTGKDIYVWAGVIAYILSERPSIDKEQVRSALRSTIQKNYDLYSLSTFSVRYKLEIKDLDIRIVSTFLNELGFTSENLQSIIEKADNARIKLEKLDLIEDPFKKKVLGIALGVISILPINFTSKTDKGFKVEALIWEYVQKNNDGQTDRHFKLKIKEIASVIIDELIPTILKIVKELAKVDNNDIEYLIENNVNDPDVELFFAVMKNNMEKVKSAIAKGANVNVTLEEIRVRHKQILDKRF